MSRGSWTRYGWAWAWAALVAVAFAVRDPLPLDETRYLAVAWEMWLRHDFLVPYLNGEIYSHKPPLMFWLFQAGWALFGVNDWWPRLVPPAFALACLFGSRALARRLWSDTAIATLAPWLLAGGFFWALYVPATMFDMLLAGFTVSGIYGLVLNADASRPRPWLGWALFGVSLGLGILAKGPVIFVHLVFPALLGPWWSARARQRPGRWYGALLGAIGLAAAVALAWVIPAVIRGGPDYEQAILWHQTANRMVESFAHSQPWWWYFPLLPVLWFPWLLWPPLWLGVFRLRDGLDPGVRLCLSWFVPVLLAFTLISAKQPHYLLPMFPAVALLSARALYNVPEALRRRSQWLPAAVIALTGVAIIWAPHWHGHMPAWVHDLEWFWGAGLIVLAVWLALLRAGSSMAAVVPMATISVMAVLCLDAAVFRATRPIFDLRPIAQEVAKLQRDDVPLAHVSKYYGQYHFLGRLRAPVPEVPLPELQRWIANHPDGYVIYYTEKAKGPDGSRAEFVQRFRGDWVHIRPASESRQILAALHAAP